MAELRIIPDWTILIELTVFLFVLAVLNVFIFKPMLKVMDKRKAFTVDASDEAGKMSDEAEQLVSGRREILSMALREAQAERDDRIGKALREADSIKSEGRSRMNKMISSTEISIESSEKSIIDELDKRSEELADMIISRVEG